MLYGTRVAQARVLPTEVGCAPYDPRVNAVIDQNITTNMFTTSKPGAADASARVDAHYVSKKLIFDVPSPEDGGGLFTSAMTNMVHSPQTTAISAFFGTIGNAMTAFNYGAIELILGGLSELPESAIVMGGPMLAPLIFSGMVALSVLNAMYQWFANLRILFWRNSNREAQTVGGNVFNTEPKWYEQSVVDGASYGIAAITAGSMIGVLFAVTISSVLPVVAATNALSCLISTFGFKGKVDNRPYDATSAMMDALHQYKVHISSIVSIALITSSFNMFSPTVGVAALAIVAAMYTNVIPLQLFTQAPPLHDMSATVKHVFAKKKCVPMVDPLDTSLISRVFGV